jgi:uncharacterized membrane protein
MEAKITKLKIIFFFIFFTSFCYSQNMNCGVNLGVEKDRNIRSTPASGTFYKMTISNTGNTSDSYIITSQNVNQTPNSEQLKISNTQLTSNLNASILDNNKNRINKITINPGEVSTFLVHITIPVGTKTNSWCYSQITAQSTKCSTINSKTVLNILLMNPNEE